MRFYSGFRVPKNFHSPNGRGFALQTPVGPREPLTSRLAWRPSVWAKVAVLPLLPASAPALAPARVFARVFRLPAPSIFPPCACPRPRSCWRFRSWPCTRPRFRPCTRPRFRPCTRPRSRPCTRTYASLAFTGHFSGIQKPLTTPATRMRAERRAERRPRM
ncbi:hypothetical protein BC936DRAFT_142449 [Jimgerdemannia flammicorona]|uniref:Uncharacterized protein n=1 Tax=Jimgerdemannia flammicorona TaxID=994334 RepID=A0A433DF65_9FUNG|nr:hypothetical protein BC936DRAFT_142449 [Jimgerdemannia flammicorona]